MSKLRYLGELSKTDAALLKKLIYGKAFKVLEFGPGASTQVIAQCLNWDGQLVSVETEPKWIDICKQNLKDLEISFPIEFIPYEKVSSINLIDLDIIFSDGKVDMRFEFAMKFWNRLRVGGKLLFHDTLCRPYMERDVLATLKEKYEEIKSVEMNAEKSNITVITKAPRRRYKNWNIHEKKEKWMHNTREPKPVNWLELLIKKCNEE